MLLIRYWHAAMLFQNMRLQLCYALLRFGLPVSLFRAGFWDLLFTIEEDVLAAAGVEVAASG